MAMGTIRASGHFFKIVAIPPAWKVFTCPSFERVPSGKIAADHLFSFIRVASLIISAMDCREFLRSILAPPPYFKLNDIEGMPLVSSILEMNFAWYLRR